MNRLLTLALVGLIATPAALAHHILGVPHYAYDEDYPQTPVLTYSVEAGPNNVRMTGYPGNPEPGKPCSLHVYISRLDTGEPFRGTVTMTVMRDRFLAPDPVVYGPVEAELEEAMFKFFPVFQDEANYTVRVAYDVEGVPWVIDLPMVAGEPGSPWAVLAAIGGGLFAFLVVMRAIRIKLRRRERLRERDTAAANPAAGSITL
jgi:hypothetical protein